MKYIKNTFRRRAMIVAIFPIFVILLVLTALWSCVSGILKDVVFRITETWEQAMLDCELLVECWRDKPEVKVDHPWSKMK